MKVSRSTKERIATIKEETFTIKRELENMRIRLEEHPGTKRIANKLVRVIDKLDEWQQAT